MVPLGTVFAREVLGSVAQFGVLMAALGTGAAIGLFAMLPLQKRLPRDKVFEWTVMGAGAFLVLAAMFSVDGLTALMISATGACAGAAYVTGFTVIQETVTDELRGRTFATLYAVVRLCLLFSLTISPLFADLYAWLCDTLGAQRITLGGFSYGFPGVRLALWAGGGLTILSGLYARHELRALRRENTVARHPAARAAEAQPPPAAPSNPSRHGEPPIASTGA
jgi:dTMP kinase